CDAEAGRIPLRRLFWLIPLFIVWANVHGGMVTGVVTLALVVAGWSIAWVIGAPSPIPRPRECLALPALVIARRAGGPGKPVRVGGRLGQIRGGGTCRGCGSR